MGNYMGIKINIILLLLTFTAISFAQDMHEPPPPLDHDGKQMQDFRNRLDELEKLKIIDALHMDEQTTLKFFARRGEHKTKYKKFRDEQKKILDEMSTDISGKDSSNTEELKKDVNKYLYIEKEIEKEQVQYINSLYDILTPKQVSELLIFQNKWMEDLKDILLRNRFRGRN
jgi:Spy/CpxP family protein refolding chaperone